MARRQRGGGLRRRTSTHGEVDPALSERIRASFLLAGPLLARFGHADMPPPGGDVIGRRRLDPHLDAFRALGATVEVSRSYGLTAPADGLRACDFFMDEPSVMATENALMAAALTPGSTVIHNAASEPHVQDLARLLLQMGARVEGIGSNVLIVHGESQLGGADYAIAPDYIEVGSFIALAACTGGELRIKDVVADDLRMTRLAFERLGCRIEYDGDDVVVPRGQRAARQGRRGRRHLQDRGRPLARVPGRPDQHRAGPGHPGRRHGPDPREDVREPAVLRRQAGLHGRSGDRLRPAPRGRQRPEPASRRAHGEPGHPRRHGHAHRGAVRRGPSEIGNIRQIDRGYERIDERLRALGARIERSPPSRCPSSACAAEPQP